MVSKRPKKYYVGGLISLIVLPIILVLATIDARKKAIHYGSFELISSFELDNPPSNVSYSQIAFKESSYTFIGIDEDTRLAYFRNSCASVGNKSYFRLRICLPENSSYNLFIQVLDALQMNKYKFTVDKNVIYAIHSSKYQYPIQYESASLADEYQYVASKIKEIMLDIKSYISNDFDYSFRIMTYSDMHPSLSTTDKYKDETKIEFYSQVIGLWFVPIIAGWLILLIISIKLANKIFAT